MGGGRTRRSEYPAGARLAADPFLQRHDGGRLLVGGWPLRMLRLTPAGALCLDGWFAGRPVGSGAAECRLARTVLDAAMAHPTAEVCDLALDDVTVVVPVFNDAAGLRQLLAALISGAGLHLASVIVVDDGSDNPEALAEVAQRYGARRVTRPVNGGPAAARNTGLELVDTPVTVFIDADVTIPAGVIQILLGHLGLGGVAAAAPRVCSQPGATLLARYEAANSPLDMGPFPSPVGPGRRVSHVPGAVLAVRTSTAKSIGGFDHRLRCGEDVDFVWRLATAGHIVRYEPAALSWHRPRSTYRAWLRQRHGYGSSAAELAARHGQAAAPAGCTRGSAAAWGIMALGHAATGAAIAAGCGAVDAARVKSVSGDAVSWPHAARLVGRAQARAGLRLAKAVARAWWPPLLVVALRSRALRRSLAVAVGTSAFMHWRRPGAAERSARNQSPDMAAPGPPGLFAEAGLRLADDFAYSIGVWHGMLARCRFDAIRPVIVKTAARRGRPRRKRTAPLLPASVTSRWCERPQLARTRSRGGR